MDDPDMYFSEYVSNQAAFKNLFPLPNVWLGVSVENQKAADERIPLLLQTPAAIRFLSCEPLLSEVSLQGPDNRDGGSYRHYLQYIDQVIVGGESGPGARPMHPEWLRGLRDQCQTAGVPFFFKQWGEYLPQKNWLETETEPDAERKWERIDGLRMYRVGKKKAGRILDGRTWDEFPEVAGP